MRGARRFRPIINTYVVRTATGRKFVKLKSNRSLTTFTSSRTTNQTVIAAAALKRSVLKRLKTNFYKDWCQRLSDDHQNGSSKQSHVHVDTYTVSNQPISEELLIELDKLSRTTYKFAIDPNNDRKSVISRIHAAEILTRKLLRIRRNRNLSLKFVCDPRTPHFNSDDITRIKELYPPGEYEFPTEENRSLRCIRDFSTGELSSLSPNILTLRSLSNYNVSLRSFPDDESYYATEGNYYEQVNHIPEPSIWTAQHCLMPTAPSISSPGIFQSGTDRQMFSAQSEGDLPGTTMFM